MNLFENIFNTTKSGVSSYNKTMEGVGSKVYDWANPNQDPIQRFLDDPKVEAPKKQAVFADLQAGKPKEAISSYIAQKYYPDTQTQFQSPIPTLERYNIDPNGNPIMNAGKTALNVIPSLLNVAGGTINLGTTAYKEGIGNTASMLGKGIVRGAGEGVQNIQEQYQQGGGIQATTYALDKATKYIGENPGEFLAPSVGKYIGKTGGKALAQGANYVAPKIKAVPTMLKKAPGAIDDIMESGVEKLATKALGSTDGTAELFKATSPSYNVFAKSKDISKIKDKARLADDAVIEAGYVPKTTTERVSAYGDSMKKYWKDVEDARGATTTKYNAGEIAKTIDDEIQRLSVKGTINPAIQGDINALMKQSDYFKGLGEIDIPTLGNQRTLINSITDWGAKTEFGDTFSSVMKKAVAKIREAEDGILGQVGNGKASDALKKYGALRSLYDDVVKQDIKALRAKGLPIEESFGRIAGTAELLGGVGQLVMNPKQAIPSIISGGSKVLLGKVAGKLKDSDYLIKTGYEKLLKSKKPTNGTTPGTTPVVRPNSVSPKAKQKPLALPAPSGKPLSANVVSVKPIILPKKLSNGKITDPRIQARNDYLELKSLEESLMRGDEPMKAQARIALSKKVDTVRKKIEDKQYQSAMSQDMKRIMKDQISDIKRNFPDGTISVYNKLNGILKRSNKGTYNDIEGEMGATGLKREFADATNRFNNLNDTNYSAQQFFEYLQDTIGDKALKSSPKKLK